MKHTPLFPVENEFTVGVTGSRTLPPDAWRVIETTIFDVEPFYGTLVWGGCVGVDREAAIFAEMADMRRHAVIPPNRSMVAPDWKEWATSYELIEPGVDDFKRRNQRIVDLSDRLIAFPLYPEDHPESRRSGTWQTVRLARRKGIMDDADIHILSQIARRF